MAARPLSGLSWMDSMLRWFVLRDLPGDTWPAPLSMLL